MKKLKASTERIEPCFEACLRDIQADVDLDALFRNLHSPIDRPPANPPVQTPKVEKKETSRKSASTPEKAPKNQLKKPQRNEPEPSFEAIVRSHSRGVDDSRLEEFFERQNKAARRVEEKIREKAAEIKAEQTKELTFKPKIIDRSYSVKSKDLFENSAQLFHFTKEKIERLRGEKEAREEETLIRELTFRPKINSTFEKSKRGVDQLYQWHERREENIAQMIRERDKRILEDCSFVPKVNKAFKALSSRHLQYAQTSTPISERQINSTRGIQVEGALTPQKKRASELFSAPKTPKAKMASPPKTKTVETKSSNKKKSANEKGRSRSRNIPKVGKVTRLFESLEVVD